MSIPDLKKMFGYSKYKMYYIENLLPPEGSTVYRCGTLVDLCLGPHIQNTGKIKAFKIMKVGCDSFHHVKCSRMNSRIPHVTSGEIKMTILCNESMVLRSQTRNNCLNTRNFWKRPQSEIIVRSVLNRSCSFSTNSPRDQYSYYPMAPLSSMRSRSCFVPNIRNVDIKRSSHLICMTSSYGRSPDIGSTIKTTCSVLR